MLESSGRSEFGDMYIPSIDKPVEGNNNNCNNHKNNNNNNYFYANRNECPDGQVNGESDAGASFDSEPLPEEKQPRSESSKRTMNAFLMFCKKHRPLVSQHYATKENRSITKILGSWWGQLDAEKKKPYEMLAQEHRTKVKAANPNVRWCKQEKTETETSAIFHDHVQTRGTGGQWSAVAVKREVPDIKDDLGSMEAAESLVQLAQGIRLRVSPISMGKLADVKQMGSLSELCAGAMGASGEPEPSFWSMNAAEHNYSAWHTNDSSALVKQEPEPTQHMRQHFLAQSRPKMGMAANGVGGTACTTTISGPVGTEPMECGGEGIAAEQGTSSSRASRSCKGKRYKEFMTNQYGGTALASATRKSPKKRTSATYSSNSSTSQNRTTLNDCRGYQEENVSFNHNRSQMTAATVVKMLPAPVDVEALRREVHHKIAKLPCEDFEAFLASKNVEKRRKKPYAVSARARRNKAKTTSPSSTP
uniref:HMG box domain-containing protein n=1 Tax=Anopheles dirus TaxID=7168 RepID=A0A182N6W2_9DIPT